MQNAARAHAPEQEVLEYTYNSRTRKWDISNEIYEVETVVWSRGGHRRCQRCWRKGCESLLLWKQYLEPTSSEQYFDDAMAQLLSSRYARKFNRIVGAKVKFVGVSVIQSKSNVFACVERFLPGRDHCSVLPRFLFTAGICLRGAQGL